MFHNLLFIQPGNSKCSSVYENCLEQSRAIGRYNCPSPSATLLIPSTLYGRVWPLLLNSSWESQVYITKRVMLQLQASHILRSAECHMCVSWKAVVLPCSCVLFHTTVLLYGVFHCFDIMKALLLERWFLYSKLKAVPFQRISDNKLIWKLMLVKSIRIKRKPLFLLGKGNKKKSKMWESQLEVHTPHACQGIKCLITACDNWHQAQLFHNTNVGHRLSGWKYIFINTLYC